MKELRSKAPIGHLLNPAFPYVGAAQTDISKTFARIRLEQALEKKRAEGEPLLQVVEKKA